MECQGMSHEKKGNKVQQLPAADAVMKPINCPFLLCMYHKLLFSVTEDCSSSLVNTLASNQPCT